jgi:hypothetical protein
VKETYANKGRNEAAKYVPDEFIEKINIFGTANECIDRIKWLSSRGINQFVTLIVDNNPNLIAKTITTFGKEVIPNFS